MRTLWILPGWFGFIFGPAPSGSLLSSPRSTVAGQAVNWVKLPVVWYRRWSQRLDLAELEDYLLTDIGLDRRDVHCETAKAFWHR